MPRLRPSPMMLATEDERDEDSLSREHGPLSLMIAIGMPRGHDPRLASEDDSDDDGSSGNSNKGNSNSAQIPRMGKVELNQRIKCCELQLDCLRALRDGDHGAVRRLTSELVQADADLDKLVGEKEFDDGE